MLAKATLLQGSAINSGLHYTLTVEAGEGKMGLFNRRKPSDGGMRRIIEENIVYNAELIEKNEKRTRHDAEYLAICLFLDDMKNRPNGKEGHILIMDIVKSQYPQHLGDVILYVGWRDGLLKLKPEAERALVARHEDGGSRD